MKHTRFFSMLFALSFAATVLTACGDESNTDSNESSVTDESSADESSFEITATICDIAVSYDSASVPDALAETIATYFYAIKEQDYDLYSEQINPLYQTEMEALLQEEYGYGMEVDFESYHETLLDYAGTEDFTITTIALDLAEQALAEEYEESTDFVGEYLDAYAEFLGDDFITELEESSTAIYDIAIIMYGEDADGTTLTIMNSLEILAVETDGTFGVLG